MHNVSVGQPNTIATETINWHELRRDETAKMWIHLTNQLEHTAGRIFLAMTYIPKEAL